MSLTEVVNGDLARGQDASDFVVQVIPSSENLLSNGSTPPSSTTPLENSGTEGESTLQFKFGNVNFNIDESTCDFYYNGSAVSASALRDILRDR